MYQVNRMYQVNMDENVEDVLRMLLEQTRLMRNEIRRLREELNRRGRCVSFSPEIIVR